MKIRFLCPAGHRLSADASLAGKKVRCAVCKQTAIVPSADQPPATAPEQVAAASAQSEPSEPEKQPPPLPRRRKPPPPPTAEPVAESPRPRRKRAPRRPRGPKLLPPDAYRADQGNVATVHWLALFLAAAVLFSVLPALRHLNLETAPGWARASLLLALVQLVLIGWMLNLPDWASVWVVMLAFALAAALYGMATAVAMATPADRPMPLDMGEIRTSAGRWCGAVLAVLSLATYLCGRTSARWRRTFDLEMAGRHRAAGGRVERVARAR